MLPNKKTPKQIPLFIDCDTGEDDAIALVLAYKSGSNLKYIITSHGNTTIANSTRNSADVMGLVGNAKTKIIKGSSSPLEVHKLEGAEFYCGEDYMGKNGLCDLQIPPTSFNSILDYGDNFTSKTAEKIKEFGIVDYIITGPCTNFAKIINYFKSQNLNIKDYVNDVYIMGTAIYEKGTRGMGIKNTSHKNVEMSEDETWAEFNIYCDPLALKVVLEADLNPVVVSWDACIPFEISLDRIQNFESQIPEGRFFVDITNAFMNLYGSENKSDFELCDPLTVMAYLGYGKIRAEKINVITEENYYGKTYSDPDGFAVRYFYTENNEEVEHIIQSMLDILEVKTKNKVYA